MPSRDRHVRPGRAAHRGEAVPSQSGELPAMRLEVLDATPDGPPDLLSLGRCGTLWAFTDGDCDYVTLHMVTWLVQSLCELLWTAYDRICCNYWDMSFGAVTCQLVQYQKRSSHLITSHHMSCVVTCPHVSSGVGAAVQIHQRRCLGCGETAKSSSRNSEKQIESTRGGIEQVISNCILNTWINIYKVCAYVWIHDIRLCLCHFWLYV